MNHNPASLTIGCLQAYLRCSEVKSAQYIFAQNRIDDINSLIQIYGEHSKVVTNCIRNELNRIRKSQEYKDVLMFNNQTPPTLFARFTAWLTGVLISEQK